MVYRGHHKNGWQAQVLSHTCVYTSRQLNKPRTKNAKHARATRGYDFQLLGQGRPTYALEHKWHTLAYHYLDVAAVASILLDSKVYDLHPLHDI